MFLFNVIVFCSALFVVSANFAFPCRTPNHEAAFCISLFSCPIMLKALGTLEPSAIDFAKRSICCDTVPQDIFVCCGTLDHFVGLTHNKTHESSSQAPVLSTTTQETISEPPYLTVAIENNGPVQAPFTSSPLAEPIKPDALGIPPDESHRDFVKRKLLPSRKYCGYQHTDDRFYTDNATALDEVPWLAHVVFLEDEDEDPLQFLDRCNGVLINRRYVLTADFCGNQARSVRLGQYYTNQTVTCVEDPDFPECTEPRLELEVEEEIRRMKSANDWHDFTLLRLAKNVTYTDFVRPICLPLDEPTRPEVFSFSGWGGLENAGSTKKRLSYTPTNVDECYKRDENKLKEAQNVTAVCFSPTQPNGELACTGDEAGPLMYAHRHQWFLDSLITSVYYKYKFNDDVRCSNEEPIGGLKITDDVLNWIVDNIRL